MRECEHYSYHLKSSHGSNGDETVSICLRCGEISVVAQKQGVHFKTTFGLYTPHSLLAASQALRWYRGQTSVEGRVWKPLDFAHLRLYQVLLHWRVNPRDEAHERQLRAAGKLEGNEFYIVAADSPNQSPHSAARLIREIYKDSYDNNPEISYWDVKGYALNVLQPRAWAENGIELLRDAFVPGEFVCPECNGRAAQQDESGNFATCPADNAIMLPMTWRQAAEEAGAIAKNHKKRSEQLENAWPDGYEIPLEPDSDYEELV